jgi:hypothetical protein
MVISWSLGVRCIVDIMAEALDGKIHVDIAAVKAALMPFWYAVS